MFSTKKLHTKKRYILDTQDMNPVYYMSLDLIFLNGKVMFYVLNDIISVKDNILCSVNDPQVSVTLTATPARLLILLIKNANKTLTYSTIFSETWEKHGLTASGSALSQHLSTLRKKLVTLGLNNGVITILPKEGIVFNARVKVVCEDVNNNDNHLRKSFYFIVRKRCILHMVKILIFYVFLHLIYPFKDTYAMKNDAEKYSSLIESCRVYKLKEKQSIIDSDEDLHFISNFIKSKSIKCEKGDKVFYKTPYTGSLKKNYDLYKVRFISYCHAAKESYDCDNFYYTWDE
jgi:DNA-binding winged helix-turn-helix (wHTH) protein